MNSENADTIEKAKRLWQQATTFNALCQLTKQFAEGKLPFMPSYGDTDVDEETKSLVPYLTQLNERGFLTTNSQPGFLEDSYKQRAYVTGFALKETALNIAKLSLYTDLYIAVFSPGAVDAGSMTPVTVADFRPFTWAGMSGFEELDSFAEVCSENAMSDLERAWHITAIDLVWGREEYLWKTLVAEPDNRYSVKPHPDLELEDDIEIYTF